MTAKELASRLDGRQYLEEMTQEEERIAKENGLVVVFGYSDDNVELRGVIDDEWGCWEGGTFWIYESEFVHMTDLLHGKSKKIEALWCDEGGPCWKYETDIPHETFRIFEEDELFCIGIVFNIEEAFGNERVLLSI